MAHQSQPGPLDWNPSIPRHYPGQFEWDQQTREKALLAYMNNVNATKATQDPYDDDVVLRLNLENPYLSRQPQVVTARIVNYFPFTLSCVVQVEFDPPVPGLPSEAILKLYDRRFARDARMNYYLAPYDLAAERAFASQIFHGTAEATLHRINRNYGRCTNWIAPSKVQQVLEQVPHAQRQQFMELCCWEVMSEMHCDEVKAYQRLRDLQGFDVPWFYGKVTMDTVPGVPDKWKEYFQVRGILLEVIDGNNVEDIQDNYMLSNRKYRQLVDMIMNQVDRIHERRVTNYDFQPRNIIMKPHRRDFKPVMIDFGLVGLMELTRAGRSRFFREAHANAKKFFEKYLTYPGLYSDSDADSGSSFDDDNDDDDVEGEEEEEEEEQED